MMMTVIKIREDHTSELTSINLKQVDYIELEGRKIVYHIANEKYYHISTLTELDEHLFDHGFDMLDKTNLVNINRIKHFDETQGKMYFVEKPDNSSKYATIALIKQKVIKHDLLRAVANNTHKSLEYSVGQSKNGTVNNKPLANN